MSAHRFHPLEQRLAANSDGMRIVQEESARFYDSPVANWAKGGRSMAVVWPRQVSMALCEEFSLGNRRQIAEFFGRHVTSVLYAADSVRDYCIHPKIATEVERVREAVRTRLKAEDPAQLWFKGFSRLANQRASGAQSTAAMKRGNAA